jgi:Toastrack DUF4097
LFLLPFFLHDLALSKDVKNLQKTFEVAAGGSLILDTDLGSIRIYSWDQMQVKIDVSLEFRGWDGKEITDFLGNDPIKFTQRKNTIEITGPLKNDWKKNLKNLAVSFEVYVPKKFNLDLSTAGSSIWVNDIEGKVETRTSGGTLNLGNIDGPVLAKTSGGSINLEGCTMDADLQTSGGSILVGRMGGDVKTHTSGGSITIEKSRGSIIAETSGGSIKVEEAMNSIEAITSGGSISAFISKQPGENCRLETSGGSVNVTLAEDVALNIDARSHSGKVNSELAVSINGNKSDDWLRGTLNGGGVELYLRTSGGNIYLQGR